MLVAALVGALTTFVLMNRTSNPSTLPSAADAERTESLARSASNVELRRLTEKLETLVRAFDHRRELAETTAPETDDLLARIEALVSRSAIATSVSAQRDVPLGTRTAALHSSLRAELLNALNLPDHQFLDARNTVGLRLDETHRLWPMSDVLATYGQPTRLAPSDLGLYLDYELDPSTYQDLSEPPLVRFLILEGVVASVQLRIER